MFTVIGCMFGGIAFGWLLRKRDYQWISKATTLLIWILLFLSRLRILFFVQHFHYGVQGSGTRYHRFALEHCPGNVHIAPVAAAGKSGRAIGSDRRRRSNFDGHDIAYHHGLIRQAICCGFAVPRLCARVFNTFHRHFLVHPVEGSEA